MGIQSIDAEDDQFAYRYDTQLLIERRDRDLDEDEISDYITEHFEGNSLIAAGDEDLIKIHFHTNEPWKILEYCSSVGEIFDIVVEDMKPAGRRRLSADAGHHDDEACVPRHRSGQHPATDLRHARPDRPLHPPLPPLLPLGITQTPPPDLPAGVPCVYPRKFQKDFSKKLLRGEGTAEDAARRIQSRASLYMTEQYG